MKGTTSMQFTDALRQRITALLRDRRFDEAATALSAELAVMSGTHSERTDSARAGGVAAMTSGAAKTAGLQTPQPLSASQALALAHFAEVAGDLQIARELFDAAAPSGGTRLPALLGLGRVLHPLGRTGEAAAALESALALRPDSVEAWCNLSALSLELGRADDALVAADRAISLKPDLSAAHVNRGDALRHLGRFAEASEAFDRAVALQPRWPAALNKLAGVRRILRDYDRAQVLLREAIAIAPQFGLARVNLGTLAIERGRLAEGRQELEAALALQGLDAPAREQAESALAMAAEHERLAPAIAEAVASEDPEPLRRALGAQPDTSRVPSREIQAMIARIATRVRDTLPMDVPRIDGPVLPQWPGIEAHFAFHRAESMDDIDRTLLELARRDLTPKRARFTPSEFDILHFERAVRERRARPEGSGTGSESWLRYWHARITAHRAEVFPGQMKPVHNLVLTSHRAIRAEPREASASCAAFFATEYLRLPPGFARATLVYFAISQIHPFFDGNGRVARFLQNAELELAGLSPLVIPRAIGNAVPGILQRVRSSTDLAPLMTAMVEAAVFTANLVGSLRRKFG